jgi:CheY-like chemotaxis protein
MYCIGYDNVKYRCMLWAAIPFLYLLHDEGPMRALVVDDQTEMRALTVTCLRMLGLQCCEVPSGMEALRYLERDTQFDVLITDLRMPQMNGLELLSEVKRRYPWLPVILVSSAGDVDICDQAQREGAAYCIDRPYLKQHFEAALRAIYLL